MRRKIILTISLLVAFISLNMSHVVMAGDINTIPVRTIAEGNGVVETVDSNVFGGGVAVGQGGSFK